MDLNWTMDGRSVRNGPRYAFPKHEVEFALYQVDYENQRIQEVSGGGYRRARWIDVEENRKTERIFVNFRNMPEIQFEAVFVICGTHLVHASAFPETQRTLAGDTFQLGFDGYLSEDDILIKIEPSSSDREWWMQLPSERIRRALQSAL